MSWPDIKFDHNSYEETRQEIRRSSRMIRAATVIVGLAIVLGVVGACAGLLVLAEEERYDSLTQSILDDSIGILSAERDVILGDASGQGRLLSSRTDILGHARDLHDGFFLPYRDECRVRISQAAVEVALNPDDAGAGGPYQRLLSTLEECD